MNRTELVAAMAEKSQLSKKDAESALKAFIDVVSEEMQKGEKIQLVASKSPKFKAGKALKDLVNA